MEIARVCLLPSSSKVKFGSGGQGQPGPACILLSWSNSMGGGGGGRVRLVLPMFLIFDISLGLTANEVSHLIAGYPGQLGPACKSLN